MTLQALHDLPDEAFTQRVLQRGSKLEEAFQCWSQRH